MLTYSDTNYPCESNLAPTCSWNGSYPRSLSGCRDSSSANIYFNWSWFHSTKSQLRLGSSLAGLLHISWIHSTTNNKKDYYFIQFESEADPFPPSKKHCSCCCHLLCGQHNSVVANFSRICGDITIKSDFILGDLNFIYWVCRTMTVVRLGIAGSTRRRWRNYYFTKRSSLSENTSKETTGISAKVYRKPVYSAERPHILAWAEKSHDRALLSTPIHARRNREHTLASFQRTHPPCFCKIAFWNQFWGFRGTCSGGIWCRVCGLSHKVLYNLLLGVTVAEPNPKKICYLNTNIRTYLLWCSAKFIDDRHQLALLLWPTIPF